MAEPHPPGNTIFRYLPSEILFFQILPRLPAKALPSFMRVCKKWHSFLKSRLFFNAYHHHHQNHPKHLVLPTTAPYNKFRSIDCESPKDSLTAVLHLPFYVPDYNNGNPGNMAILTSLHGLLCVGITKAKLDQEYSDLILWNPLTGEYKTLSKKGCHEECYKVSEGIFGLYYISSDDDYKLLRVTHHLDIYIYTLRSDSWRKVESTEDFQQIASNLTSCGSSWKEPIRHILLNEKLYILKQVDRRGTVIHSYSILRFDTKTEKFKEIAAPSFGNQMTDILGFMVLTGCIHFYVAILIEEENYMTNRCCYEMIELWRMDGDGDWTKVLTYGPMPIFIWGRSLLHVMWNGNLLIHYMGDVYLLDIKKHTKEMVFKCESFDYKRPPFGKYIETVPPIGKYIETTLSPNRYV